MVDFFWLRYRLEYIVFVVGLRVGLRKIIKTALKVPIYAQQQYQLKGSKIVKKVIRTTERSGALETWNKLRVGARTSVLK